jgi:hypothetical protein
MKLINPAHLRRPAFATPIAVAAALGGSTLVDPATACAVPKDWNHEGYAYCYNQAYQDWKSGVNNKKQFQELAEGCCHLSGGKWTVDATKDAGGYCTAAAEAQPTQRGAAPPPVVATQNPAPPPPPFRHPGVIVETFTPAPASPR